MKNNLKIFNLFKSKKPLIGVIHLFALPGNKDHPGMKKVIEKALIDLQTLEEAGFDGVLVENDGDHPPHIGPNKKTSQNFEDVMKVIIKKAIVPVGLEILYDMPGTIKLAAKVKAQFVRLDVFVDSGKTPYGPVVYAEAEKLVQLKELLCSNLLLFTDVHVKHLVMLDKQKTLKDSVREAVKAGSDGIIITGIWTSKEPTVIDCITAKIASKGIPIFIGSGFSVENAEKFISIVDGCIVASSIKTGEYVDFKKAQKLSNFLKRMKEKV